ncbi:3-isopropylmalate dehydratase small subunit [Sphingobium ummariense]
MKPFVELSGIAAPLLLPNIDTDQILPKQFLTAITRSGLGQGLFHDFRYTVGGEKVGSFILNRAPWDDSKILIAGENFGCGSSREHAPWALLDFGIRCVIAPSFADIFYNNCLNNGLLLVKLPSHAVASIGEEARAPSMIEVNLPQQTVTTPSMAVHHFDIDPSEKNRLLNGIDQIAGTLAYLRQIDAFEAGRVGKILSSQEDNRGSVVNAG